MVRADEAVAREPGDPALIVGLVDSGVNRDHPELAGKLRTGVSTVHLADDAMPRDYKLADGSGGRLPRDQIGHGTSCASIIGARGLQMPAGLAGAALVLPIRSLAASHVPGSKALSAVGRAADIDPRGQPVWRRGARGINLPVATAPSAPAPADPPPPIHHLP